MEKNQCDKNQCDKNMYVFFDSASSSFIDFVPLSSLFSFLECFISLTF